MNVRLAGITGESVADGPGLRMVLFFQGCGHHCLGCHNPQTWPEQGGVEYKISSLLRQLPDTPLIKGITLSGGDPFYQPEAAALIAQDFKARGKDVWVYTGFVWEELLRQKDPAHLEILQHCDVLVDGPYQQALRDLTLPFRGSANQRMILSQKSLKAGKIIEWRPGG